MNSKKKEKTKKKENTKSPTSKEKTKVKSSQKSSPSKTIEQPKLRVIARHEELSDVQRTSKKLRLAQKAQAKEFKKAQTLYRPKLNKTKVLEYYSESAEETAKRLTDLALAVMSLETAFKYAESMISQDIDGEGVEWQTDSAMRIAEKIQTIETTRIMLDHFNLPKQMVQAVIAQTIAKQFGVPATPTQPTQPQQNTGIPTFSNTEVRKVLEQYGKDIQPIKP